MKKVIETQKTEIVKQIRLTSNQRFALVTMQNSGGRDEGRRLDWKACADLRNLFLVEERSRYTDAEKKPFEKEIAAFWRDMASLVRSKNTPAAGRKLDEIKERERRLTQKCWWLTKEADEYLLKGRVVISR